MSDVRLKINGDIHSGWKETRLGFSIDNIANTFQLQLTDKWGPNSEPRLVRMGANCEVWIDKIKVITGYVDDVLPVYDDKSHMVSVTGRSKAADLVDSSHPGKQFKNRDLKQLADEICKPFGIKVFIANGVDIGKAFKEIEIETGETMFEFLEHAARIRALRFMSTIDGDLVITKASTQRVSTALILGENILKASGSFSIADRFSEVTIIGSQSGSDDGWGAVAAHMKGSYKEPLFAALKRHRPLVITADGSVTLEDCKRRAQWEVNTRHGRGQSINYTVNGWFHSKGLWQPNTIVPVRDPYQGIDQDLMIADVQLISDDQGQRTELRVIPPQAFDLVTLPEPEAAGASNAWG